MRVPGWPAINPSDLRHQIQIQQLSTTPDSYGQPAQTWATILTVNANIATATQRELYQAGALTSQVTHVITMRWPQNATISPGMRVLFGSHTYRIQTCNNVDGRNILLILQALEINGSE